MSFSSCFRAIRNHINDIGSANYNAGNNFLDALVLYRQQLHLPALSVSLPWVLDAGYVYRNAHLLRNVLGPAGYKCIPAQYLFELLERYTQNQHRTPCPILFTVDWNVLHSNRAEFPIRVQKVIEQESSITRQQQTHDADAESGLKSLKVVDIGTPRNGDTKNHSKIIWLI